MSGLDMSLDDMISSGRRGGKASSARADKKSARPSPYGVGGMNRIAGGKTFAGSKTCNNCGARGHGCPMECKRPRVFDPSEAQRPVNDEPEHDSDSDDGDY